MTRQTCLMALDTLHRMRARHIESGTPIEDPARRLVERRIAMYATRLATLDQD